MSMSTNSTGFDIGFSRKIHGEAFTIKLATPPQPASDKLGEWKDKDDVNPFWWIQPTSEEGEANIVTKLVTHSGTKFNVFTNSVAVKKNDLLKYFVEKKRPAGPLAGATVDKPAGPPAKKAPRKTK